MMIGAPQYLLVRKLDDGVLAEVFLAREEGAQEQVVQTLLRGGALQLKSSPSAASSPGSEPCVFTRRRNSSFRRSITLLVRAQLHRAAQPAVAVEYAQQRRPQTTPDQIVEEALSRIVRLAPRTPPARATACVLAWHERENRRGRCAAGRDGR